MNASTRGLSARAFFVTAGAPVLGAQLACKRRADAVEFEESINQRSRVMRIEYHDLSDKDFERLVVAICMEILGAGVASFSSGKDGSRDARFEGTAACFPSATSPYI